MKFTQPVAMAIPTKEDFERDLKEQLIKLGYKIVELEDFKKLHILITNYKSNDLVTNSSEYCGYKSHCFIDHYNPQLFLALASMSDEVNGIVGEWFNQNIAFLDVSYDLMQKKDNHQNFVNTFTRKATKEELINHFSKAEKCETSEHLLDAMSLHEKHIRNNFVFKSEHQKMITTYEGRLTELEEKLGKQNVAIVNNLAKISNLERQLERVNIASKVSQGASSRYGEDFQPKNLLPYVLISTSEKVLDRVVFEVKRVNKTPTHHDLIFENEGAKERFKFYYDYEFKDSKPQFHPPYQDLKF